MPWTVSIKPARVAICIIGTRTTSGLGKRRRKTGSLNDVCGGAGHLVPSRKLSKLTLSGAGATTAARVVVNPINRPIKIMPIHIASDKAPTVLAIRGVAEVLSQLRTVRLA